MAPCAHPRLDTATPAVLLKFDRNTLHHGTLAAIRTLGRRGVPVEILDVHARPPAARSRYVSEWRTWPASLAHPYDAIRLLIETAQRAGGQPVLIPVDDAGAIFAAEHAAELSASYRMSCPPSDLPRSLADKEQLAHTCERLGVPHPATVVPTSWAELVTCEPPGGRWPVVVKQIRPWEPSCVPGLPSTVIVHDHAQLASLATRATSKRPALLLQQHVPNGGDPDWFYHGYHSAEAGCLVAFTGQKLRSWPPRAGLTMLGCARDNPGVRAQVNAMLAALAYVGIVDVDLRRDGDTGRYHVLDVNPRVGAQFSLLRSEAGVDVVRALHLDLTGRPVPTGAPADGRTLLVENCWLVALLRDRSEGRLDARTWRHVLRRVDELAWWAPDDPRPAAAMAAECAAQAWRRRTQFVRRTRPHAVPMVVLRSGGVAGPGDGVAGDGSSGDVSSPATSASRHTHGEPSSSAPDVEEVPA